MEQTHSIRTAPGRKLHRLVGIVSFFALFVGALLLAYNPVVPLNAADQPTTSPKPTLVGGKALFADWPADRKPDAVIVFSGQTYGYLQPCGCSRPQMGGLERRAVLIDQLKAKGWPVAAIDLGDVYEQKTAVEKQGHLKYIATMNSLREMGYISIGVGKTELAADFYKLIAAYSLQKEQRPFLLAANAFGKDGDKLLQREEIFPPLEKGKRPLVEAIEVAEVGKIPIGVTSVVGKSLHEDNDKHNWNPLLTFPNAKAGVGEAVKAFEKHPAKPQVRILLFQGPADDAAKVAADFPSLRIVLCLTEDGAPPPLQPQQVNHANGNQTLIVQVGQRGQNVGVVGVFKKADGSLDLKYQLVPLGEEFITPGKDEEAIKTNKTLQILEDYARQVKDANLLPKYPRTPHPEQIRAQGLNPPVKLTYVGSEACKKCHEAEFAKWKESHHSHAMATLEKYAKRPSLRQFDGECVQCHSVGFHHDSGYVDDAKTSHLRDVGCESCHGPGSGHAAAPNDKDLLAFMSPWKQAGAQKLPDAKFMKEMADTPPLDRGKKVIPLAQQLLIRRVESTCMKCHDHDADPNFDLFVSWPKIDHTSLPQKK